VALLSHGGLIALILSLLGGMAGVEPQTTAYAYPVASRDSEFSRRKQAVSKDMLLSLWNGGCRCARWHWPDFDPAENVEVGGSGNRPSLRASKAKFDTGVWLELNTGTSLLQLEGRREDMNGL
jgi:hypothetical protein